VDTFALEGDFSGKKFSAAGSLIEKIKAWLESIAGPMPSKDEFLKIVGAAYDTFVAPIDLPGVPNFIEPRIDAMLRVAVLAAAGKLYDQFAS
jgi:hypothetical protein